MLSFLKKHLDYVCYVKLPSSSFLCSSENKETVTTWWANEMTWKIKHFLMHYWLIHMFWKILLWVCLLNQTLAWILNCAKFLPCSTYTFFIRHGQEAKWRRICFVGWSPSDRGVWGTRIETLQERYGCLLCSREVTAEVPISSHSPRNGMDGHLCSDLPELSSHCWASSSL